MKRTDKVEGTGTEPEDAADGTAETPPVDGAPSPTRTPPEPEGDAQPPGLESPVGNGPSAPAPSGPEDEGQPLSEEQRAALLDELKAFQTELRELQGETPPILPGADAQAAVAKMVADWTGIPVGRMVKDEVAAVLKLPDTLNWRVIGQRHALGMIARRVRTSRARLDNSEKPIGVFMLCGPSGGG